ncbi:MAG: hypothetical protein GX682_00910 [Clostridiaceae bacterium]|nr:hypothetical protein [Clostridiaceae bacterium]
MKQNKKLKIILIIALIILISMISFGGIYIKNKNSLENVLPEYLLGKDFKGYRKVEMVPNKETQTISYDADGIKITEENSTKEVAKTVEEKINSDEALNKDNFERTKEIIENRLNLMQVSNYIIKQNKDNGNIVLEIPENDNTDKAVGNIYLQGKFEIVDNDTQEVLITNEDIKIVKSGYGNTGTGTTAVCLNIEFNKEGTEKFRNISNTYIKTTVTNENNEEEQNMKQVTLKIDDSTILTTYFDKEITNGILQLTMGSSGNSTTEELKEYIVQANDVASLLNSGKMPIVYEVEQNKYIVSDITINQIQIAIIVAIVLAAIGMLYLIIKYKEKGIYGSLLLIGYVAIVLIALRYFNVEISIEALIAIALCVVLQYISIYNMLKENEIMKVIKKYTLICIPALIISIVFTFFNITFGPVLVWGILISVLYNLSISNLMLK